MEAHITKSIRAAIYGEMLAEVDKRTWLRMSIGSPPPLSPPSYKQVSLVCSKGKLRHRSWVRRLPLLGTIGHGAVLSPLLGYHSIYVGSLGFLSLD